MAESRPTPGALSDIGDALIPQQWPVALHCPRKPFSKRELVDKRQVSHGSKPTLFCQRLVLCRRKSIVLSPLGSLGDRNDASPSMFFAPEMIVFLVAYRWRWKNSNTDTVASDTALSGKYSTLKLDLRPGRIRQSISMWDADHA